MSMRVQCDDVQCLALVEKLSTTPLNRYHVIVDPKTKELGAYSVDKSALQGLWSHLTFHGCPIGVV